MKFGLSRNELAFKSCARFHHGLALLRDIDRSVLAGELTEILLRCLKVLIDRTQPFFQENPFSVRRRCGKLSNHRIELIDIRSGDCCRTLGIVIGHCNRDDSALVIFRNGSILSQVLPGGDFQAVPINAIEIKSIDNSVFHRSAA